MEQETTEPTEEAHFLLTFNKFEKGPAAEVHVIFFKHQWSIGESPQYLVACDPYFAIFAIPIAPQHIVSI
jgi:hypothetical protein